jgi:hypothetical protein
VERLAERGGEVRIVRDGESTGRFERRVLLMGAAVAGVWAAGRYRWELDRDDPLEALPGYVRAARPATREAYLGALHYAVAFAELPSPCGLKRASGGLLGGFFYSGTGPLWRRAEVHAAECPDCVAAAGIALAELDQGTGVVAIRELLEDRFAAAGDAGPSG